MLLLFVRDLLDLPEIRAYGACGMISSVHEISRRLLERRATHRKVVPDGTSALRAGFC